MHDGASSALTAWANFYVIVGSSAAALTGLMFVVITLVADVRMRSTRDGISTFSTPTVFHFCAALLISAILSAPWPSLTYAALIIAAAGLCGVVYAVRLITHAKEISDYEPDLEDWLWYMILPLAVYTVVVISALAGMWSAAPALFGLAGASLALIFIGIHNAWDVVTYVAKGHLTRPDDAEKTP